MTDQVSVNTDDLSVFLARGSEYRARLERIADGLVDHQASTAAAVGHVPSESWKPPFRALLSTAADNDGFVSEVHRSLLDRHGIVVGDRSPRSWAIGSDPVDRLDRLIDALVGRGFVELDSHGEGAAPGHELGDVVNEIAQLEERFAGLPDALDHVLELVGIDNLEPEREDDRPWYRAIGDGIYRISSLPAGSPTWVRRLATDRDGLAADNVSFLAGLAEAVIEIGLFGHDLNAASPVGPGFWIEYARSGGDTSRHRGIQLVQVAPQLASLGLSVVPGSPQFDEAMAQVERQGTWQAHPGVAFGRTLTDWDTFSADPARWAGRLTPDVVISALTGGGGAMARVRVARRSGSINRRSRRGGLGPSTVESFRVPHGFDYPADFEAFSGELYRGLRRSGYDDVTVVFQGSSVTGRSFRSGQPFDLGRVSDFDVALASPQLLARARAHGLPLRSSGSRTGPLTDADRRALDLEDLSVSLSARAGRQVNFMIYRSVDGATSRLPSIVVR